MPQHTIRIAPSLLGANLTVLGEQVLEAERGGADRIHVDVMDGHFVPNITFGVAVVKALRPITRLPLEIHLMTTDPDAFLDEFVAARADSFLVHWEGNNDLHRTVQHIRSLHRGAGVVINPATPASVLEEILPEVEQVLVMTVNPGFGHQQFLRSTLPKITRVRRLIEQIKPQCNLEVDGGINAETASLAVAAGADVLVAGTSVFSPERPVAAGIAELQTVAHDAMILKSKQEPSAMNEKKTTQLSMIRLGQQ